MLMLVTEVERGDEQVVALGPCPGCARWQVEYTRTLSFDYETLEWFTLVEACLQEHLDECPGLQRILADTP